MAFSVEDFHDLIELLAQHPEWRTELRRHVLSDELLELPTLVRQLVEAQNRAESRLDRLEAALRTLAEAQARTESTLRDMVDSQSRTTDRLGDLDGRMLEIDFRQKGPAYLSPIARRLRVVESGPLADLLDDAVDEGRLTPEERNAIMRTDVVLSGRRRDDGQDIYLLVEVSGGVRTHDVERALDRAALLSKLGRPVLPIVAGRRIHEDAAAMARTTGAWYAGEGQITPPLLT
jgi:hypothetical protein